MTKTDVIDTFVEVSLPESSNFLKVKETLTRMGVPNKDKNKLFQTCHILHKRGKYYVVHFKEMFMLDGRTSSLTKEDIGRRNRIVALLKDWGLIVEPEGRPFAEKLNWPHLTIIPYPNKSDWELICKYTVGKK